MSSGINLSREEAKRIYKENAKKVPKSKRMPFSEFYKQFKSAKKAQQSQPVVETEQKDFNFDEMVNKNDLNEVVEGEVVGQAEIIGNVSEAVIEDKKAWHLK